MPLSDIELDKTETVLVRGSKHFSSHKFQKSQRFKQNV